MQALAEAGRPGVAAAEVAADEERLASICGSVNPSADNPPACKKVRRAIGLAALPNDHAICRYREVPGFVKTMTSWHDVEVSSPR